MLDKVGNYAEHPNYFVHFNLINAVNIKSQQFNAMKKPPVDEETMLDYLHVGLDVLLTKTYLKDNKTAMVLGNIAAKFHRAETTIPDTLDFFKYCLTLLKESINVAQENKLTDLAIYLYQLSNALTTYIMKSYYSIFFEQYIIEHPDKLDLKSLSSR